MKDILFGLGFFIILFQVHGQTFTARTNELSFDFSNNTKLNSTIPVIDWKEPQNNILYQRDVSIRVRIVATIHSRTELKSVTMDFRDPDTQTIRLSTQVPLSGDKLSAIIQRDIHLEEGKNELVIVAENKDGLKATARKTIYSGENLQFNASSLERKDYALLFVTDKYDQFSTLSNPIFDGHTIAEELESKYGFSTEIVENATRAQIFDKLSEYAAKKFGELDELFIFFAGHGTYDENLKAGFVVPRDAIMGDPGHSSYIEHIELETRINKFDCKHVLLAMDVCFGGTFAQNLASRAADEEIYAQTSQMDLVLKKLQFTSRKFITSGNKEYVPDGTPGHHSPFAKQFIAALETMGGDDGVLSMSEIEVMLERLKTMPQHGGFGADQQGSDFVFVVK